MKYFIYDFKPKKIIYIYVEENIEEINMNEGIITNDMMFGHVFN